MKKMQNAQYAMINLKYSLTSKAAKQVTILLIEINPFQYQYAKMTSINK